MKRKHDIQNVVETGKNLFWEKGYNSVGTQEIIEESGMTRGAFYNAFKSKEGYLIEGIKLYAEAKIEQLSKHFTTEIKSPFNRLKSYYTNAIIALPQDNYKGCFLNNITSEMGGINKTIASTTRKYNNKIILLVEECVMKAQAANEVHGYLNSKEVAQLIHYAYLGAITQAKSSRSNEEALSMLRALLQVLTVR